MDAFAATLEELADADLILHVADASAPQLEEHIEAVKEILQELGVDHTPAIMVFNKMDLVGPAFLEAITRRYHAVAVSALSRETLDPLIHTMEERVEAMHTGMTLDPAPNFFSVSSSDPPGSLY